MANKILVLIEHREGKVLDYNWGNLGFAVTLANKLNAEVSAVILAQDSASLVQSVKSKKINEIITVHDPKLEKYSPDTYAYVMQNLVSQGDIQVVVAGHTSIGWDFLPKLAVRLNVGLVSEVNGVEGEGENLIFKRQVYNGKLVEKVRVKSKPYLLTVERGGFPDIEEGGTPQVSNVSVDLSQIEVRTKIIEYVKSEKGGVDLTKSSIIVSGGRGLGKKENFQIVKDLAEALGGDYAASRPVVDNEWVERDRQVGSSGKTVKPKLYLACGISGAIQHLSGMKKSDVIVALNKDPDAPIFGVATYGVIGDLFEVIPALIEEAKKQGVH